MENRLLEMKKIFQVAKKIEKHHNSLFAQCTTLNNFNGDYFLLFNSTWFY